MKKIFPIALIAVASFSFVKCGDANKAKTEGTVAFDINDIDHSAHACEDFYQWSVGTWMKNNPVPGTESRWMSFNMLSRENDAKLQAILNDITSKSGHKKGSSAQLIADLYKSAKNRDANADKNLDVLRPYFAEIDNIENLEGMFEAMPSLMSIGIYPGMGFYVGADRKNSAMTITHMYQGGLSLPNRDYYLKDDKNYQDIRAAYLKHIDTMFQLAGFENGSEAADKILAVETELAKISWSKKQKRNPNKTYNIKYVDQFDATLPNIPVRFLLESYGIKGIDSMVVGQPSYIAGLDSVLATQSIDDIKTLLKWALLNSYARHVNAEMEMASFNFYGKTLSGKKEMKPKEERLLKLVDRMLSQPFGKLFVEKHFPKESKDYISEMIENLRLAYKESIENLEWMTDSTKEKALEKLAAFTYKVGYPDKWRDYSKLEIQDEVLVQNVINIKLYNRAYMIDKLGKPVDRDEWGMPPQMVNAYYNPSNNEIVFPAGILQPPFFHPDFDDAINYGGIGGVIGHEFTHGFDDQGSKFDGSGNLENWWSAEDRAAFEALTSKLSEQYSSYNAIDTMHVDGDLTLGENIADLGGVTLGFAALEKKLGDNPPAPIDGFTWQQRFFLGWANVWKGNITDEELKSRLINDYHSPAKYRVLGPLSNSPEFVKAFGDSCSQGNMIKPAEERIKIW